jgi:hypothetical protein
MTSDTVQQIQNAMVMSKLAESVECVTIDNYGHQDKFVVLKGMPFEFRSYVLFATGIIRSEGGAIYDDRVLRDIRTLWEAVEYKFTIPEPKRKPRAHATYLRAWQPTPEYIEKFDDNMMIRGIRETINELARTYSGQDDETDKYGSSIWSFSDIDYKPIMAAIYSKLTEQ